MSIIATDSNDKTATNNFSVTIGTVPELQLANQDQSTRVGTPYNYDTSQNGGTFIDEDNDDLSYEIELLPVGQGLTIDGTIISGTPSIEDSITVNITVTDDDGNTALDSFQLTVQPDLRTQVYVTQTRNRINVFAKGSTDTSKKYLRYQFQKFDNVRQRSFGWTWRFLHEATLEEDSTFTIGDSILNGGENFFAIKEIGKSDFMGGINHGDHSETSFTLIIDGEEKAIDGTTSYVGKEIELKQAGILYEVDNPELNETALMNTDFTIKFGENTLRNRVEFVRDTELATALVTMLSIHRHLNGDENAELLTATGEWGPDFVPTDISEFGHKSPRTSSNEIRLYGPSGFRFEIEVTEGWDETISRSIINNGRTNNKPYLSPIGFYPSSGPGFNAPEGYVIDIEAKYRLDTTN